jgi:hypothetical protein
MLSSCVYRGLGSGGWGRWCWCSAALPGVRVLGGGLQVPGCTMGGTVPSNMPCWCDGGLRGACARGSVGDHMGLAAMEG